MKKTIALLVTLICVFTTFAQTNTELMERVSNPQQFSTPPSSTQRLGGSAEIAVIGGEGFAYGGTIEYKYLSSKDNIIKNNVVGGNILVGATLAEGVHLLVGGGYERNLTYERGQVYAMAKFNSPMVVLSGKLLLSQFKGYSNNYEVALTVFPGQNIFGIGGFYQTEYACTNIGAKVVFRFGKTNGASSKKRNDCGICGL